MAETAHDEHGQPLAVLTPADCRALGPHWRRYAELRPDTALSVCSAARSALATIAEVAKGEPGVADPIAVARWVAAQGGADASGWVTTKEAAERTGESERTWRRRASRGDVEALRKGGRWLVSSDDVTAFGQATDAA